MKKIRGYKDVNVRWKNLILISFHCCVRIRPEYIMLPFWGNRKTSEYRVVCFTEKQRNSLRGGSLLAFPLYTLSDRYSSFFFRFPIAEIVAPRCVHDFAWPHPPFVFLVNFPIQLHRYLMDLSKNHRTTIDLKEKNTGEMKMKISHTVIYQF